jgi:hypothetical protein
VGTAAFELGACDSASSATSVRLAHRSALFAPDEPVSRPLSATISASVNLHADASGGAAPSAASELLCTAAVRPYVRDLEHGTIVYLTPGRYQLRPLATETHASPSNQGWTLEGAVSVRVEYEEYEVVDTETNRTLLHDAATLECRTERVGGVQPVADRDYRHIGYLPGAPPIMPPISLPVRPHRSIGSATSGWWFAAGMGVLFGAIYGGVGFGLDFEPFKYFGVGALAVAGVAMIGGTIHAIVLTSRNHHTGVSGSMGPSPSGNGAMFGARVTF